MRHKLFLIHGMGAYDGDKWAKEVKAVLVAAWKKYPKLAAVKFDDQFEIEMVHYDPIFQGIVTKWQTDSTALGKLADQVGAAEVGQLVGWLKTAGKTDGNFIWSHAADVLLYRLSATVRQRVVTHVAKQIIEGVEKQYEEHQRSNWSVIAHSLGTAVTHDALDMLAVGQIPGVTVTAFDPRIEQAQVVAMVANVSRVLEAIVDVYQSAVKPGRAGQSGRSCLRFLNMRHFLDPFTIPRMFRPQSWPDAATVADGRYSYIEVEHVHEVNVHDICHYLRNPAAHIPLFRALAGQTRITKEQEKKALDEFKPFGPMTDEKAAKLKQKLSSMAPSMGETWRSFVGIWDGLDSLVTEEGK
ncbi:MAG: hypothetical protein ABIV11_10305 [Gemmatimonadaceae bacterium]